MGRRNRVKVRGRSRYVERNKDGEFMDWTEIDKSIAADMRTKGKKVKKGYGHMGDL